MLAAHLSTQKHVFSEKRSTREKIYQHHPDSKKRKSSEGNPGSIHPYGRCVNAGKTGKTHVYHSDSLACQAHFREEGSYGGGRYFHFPCYSRADPNNPNWIAQKKCPNGMKCFCRKPPLKPSCIHLPKGPSRTKSSTESKFGTGREICHSSSRTPRKVLGSALSLGRKGSKTAQMAKHYGSSKAIRIQAPE